MGRSRGMRALRSAARGLVVCLLALGACGADQPPQAPGAGDRHSAAWAAEKKAPSKKTTPAPAKPAKKSSIAQDPYLGAIVVDAATGKVLFENQADAKGYPASVLKLMDLLIALEKIQQGQLSLQDQVPVSAKASKTGGSQVYLKAGEVFPLGEMMEAIVIHSANDAATAVAEAVAGSTDAFVALMNERAQQLGMRDTVYRSVHGLLPGKGQNFSGEWSTSRPRS